MKKIKKIINSIKDKAETFYIDVYKWNKGKINAIAILGVIEVALTIILVTI